MRYIVKLVIADKCDNYHLLQYKLSSYFIGLYFVDILCFSILIIRFEFNKVIYIISTNKVV